MATATSPSTTTKIINSAEIHHNESMDFAVDSEELDLELEANSSLTLGNGESNRKRGKVKAEIAQMEEFAHTETARVNRWRLFVIASILVVGGFVSVFSYLILQRDENTSTTDAVSKKSRKTSWDFENGSGPRQGGDI
jgi:hypothetical protein